MHTEKKKKIVKRDKKTHFQEKKQKEKNWKIERKYHFSKWFSFATQMFVYTKWKIVCFDWSESGMVCILCLPIILCNRG